MMGGAGDLPHRSSSPLKRRAEEFDTADQSDDVDMLKALDTGSEVVQDVVQVRGGSVDMLRDEASPEAFAPEDKREEIRPSTEDVPSIDEQIAKVKEIVAKNNETPLVEGSRVYLVSKKWLSKVLSRGSDVKGSEDSAEEIGPVDNSDIIQEVLKDAEGADFARLHPGLGTESFEYFPLEAWDLVVSWYGIAPGSAAITRTAHNTNQDSYGVEQYQYELYPPVFKLHRVWSAISPVPLPQKMKASHPEALMLVSSQSEKLLSFLTRAKKELQIDISTKVRMWRIPVILPAAASSALSNSSTSDAQTETAGVWSKLLVDSPTFTALEKGVQREDLAEAAEDVSVNLKYNGKRTLAMAGLLSDETIVFEEQIKESPTSPGIWLTAYSARDAPNTQISSRPPAAHKKASTLIPSVPITRGRSNRNGKTLGVVGLQNMGNTCYMNSALQCVKSVEELTKYFLIEEYMNELNPDNPLGNRGEVASSYGRLLQEMFKSSNQGSIRPANFKNVISRYAPTFSGYGQQDSQEFVGFLLDGLQEDLSRVKKKPYIEKPDSTDEMVNNPELIREMAAKVWDITKKRDDSVIADLFTGMYKSTLVCPVCTKVSITFDPFNNLTLQLPIADSFSHTVTFFPLNDAPVDILVDIDKNATIKGMKEFIGKRVDVSAERLVAIDHWNQKIYKIYEDSETVSEIGSNDRTHVYELDAVPTNWPVPPKPAQKKKKFPFYGSNEDQDPLPHWDDPIADRMLVPVLHRVPNSKLGRFNKPFLVCLNPFFITLSKAEAYDMNIIKRKILEKVATLTDHTIMHDEPEDENSNSDIVITTGSDADSSGDGKVTASSVDGEDDVVDITMKDATSTDEQNGKSPIAQDFPLKKFRSRRPKFLDPSEYLQPELQNMFDITYFSENSDVVPTGWHSVGEDKVFPNITERDPQLQAEIRQAEERGRRRSEDSSTEGSDDDQVNVGSITRMEEESSDDEDSEPKAISAVRPIPRRPNPIKVGLVGLRKSGLKTYSKKGNKLTDRLSRQVSEDLDELAGPLVRIGEGICIDWKETAFEALFSGDPSDTFRGASCTLNNIEKLHDPVLDAKIKARAFRKRNGVTLDECLDEFQREEILSELDTWYCPRCKEHQRASKKFELWKTPDILIIHLKRFSSSSSRREKLDFLVDFPLENLDISSRVIETEPGKQEVYDLFAVDDHWGGLGGGHYTAYAKSFLDNEWYEYNDSMTQKISNLDKIVGPAAYLLFYRRRSDIPLGGPKIREIVTRYDNPDEVEDSSLNDSGEDQRLVANSSQLGSSSVLTGVDPAHLRGGSTGIQTAVVGPAMIQDPPAYREAMEDDDTSTPLLLKDTHFNDGLLLEDEGLGFEDQPTAVFSKPSWSFTPLKSGHDQGRHSSSNGSVTSDRSDAVACGSDISEEAMQERINEFNAATTDDEFIADSVPDVDIDDDVDKNFVEHVMRNKLHVVEEAKDNEELESDENVDEIHV